MAEQNVNERRRSEVNDEYNYAKKFASEKLKCKD